MSPSAPGFFSFCCSGPVDSVRHRSFTLIEMMIVILIGVMAAALVVPVIGRLPARVAIRKAEADLEAAFTTASRRARAVGQTVSLELDLENYLARVKGGSGSSDQGLGLDDGGQAAAKEGLEFRILKQIQWEAETLGVNPVYVFLPNGQADGPELVFTLRKRTFRLSVDNLTGRMNMVQADG